ncbi:hypothetical protein D3C76_1523580 [compost metagenome]
MQALLQMAGKTEQVSLFLAQLRQLLQVRTVVQLRVKADPTGLVSPVHALTQLAVAGMLEHIIGGHAFTGNQPT